ncbi:quinone oxidoreductase family protein [Mycobacterium canetti]|uniref:quinone oxidoreductase family protein n=1 Tax=Mycobacterium canetti TaxID=78331 RepID=UPI001E5413D4|nr:quinone oxidoreductase [Mycobacterium canetti]
MHAIEVNETGGPDVLRYVDKPQPRPGHGELLIKAEAIGVNFIDTYFRSGQYPRELPFVIGSEVCGTVVAVGPGASTADTAIGVGDRVVSASANGAYAAFCTAPASLTAKVPDDVTSEVAASALLKGLTAHYLLKSVYPVKDGDTVLVHAGAGGVGLILTQWATHLGARVITTVSTAEKAKLSRDAGADEVLDYPADAWQFAGRVRELTGGAGVQAVYDGVGATTFDASLACLAVRGTLALFGAASGPVPPVDPQRLNAAGSVYLTRPSLFHFIRTADEFGWRAAELFDAIGSEVVTVAVGGRYPLADAARAHQDLEARKTIGSVVLLP